MALPLTEEYWYFDEYGRAHASCKSCRRKTITTVECKKLQPLLKELVERIGYNEAVRRTELSKGTFSNIFNENCSRTKKETARVIILTLYQVRKEMRCEGIAWASTATFRERARLESMLGY